MTPVTPAVTPVTPAVTPVDQYGCPPGYTWNPSFGECIVSSVTPAVTPVTPAVTPVTPAVTPVTPAVTPDETPFSAFGAFGAFSAFGAFGAFSAFGAFGAFSAFGAFGAFGAYGGGPTPTSVGPDTLILTTTGYVMAKDLKVGDILVSTDVPGLGMSFTKQEMIAWTNDPENLTIIPDKTTTVKMVGLSNAPVVVMINGETYSGTHHLLTKRDDVAQMILSADLLTTDKLWSTQTNTWIDIVDLVITQLDHQVVSINCEPLDIFFTENFLVYDGYQIDYPLPDSDPVVE